MKRFIKIVLILIITFDMVDHNLFDDNLYNYLKEAYFKKDFNIVFNEKTLNKNKYLYKEYTSNVKLTDDFYPKNKGDLLNIYYTALNNGLDNFSFYCTDEYDSCIQDVGNLSKDIDKFSYLNQLVHPYNSFKTIKSTSGPNKRIDVTIEKKYSKEDIDNIEIKMDQIITKLNINNYSNVNDKIKIFHDYLVNNNKYDTDKDKNHSIYHSDSAIGPLYEGYSICSGYSDAMSIFLYKMNLDNVKVITTDHVWNATVINNSWYHIDVTWDDPVVNTGENMLRHDYFLINTDTLLKKDLTQHNFDRNLFEFIK